VYAKRGGDDIETLKKKNRRENKRIYNKNIGGGDIETLQKKKQERNKRIYNKNIKKGARLNLY
jgi:hypothetical protein